MERLRSTTNPSELSRTIMSGAFTARYSASNEAVGFGLKLLIICNLLAISAISACAFLAKIASSPLPSNSRFSRIVAIMVS